jgi:5'-nucleotidase
MRRFLIMRRNITILAMFAVNFLILADAAGAEALTLKDGDRYTLTILHTNDIHGHVDNLPRFSTVIKNARKNVGTNLLVLDVGDVFLRGEFEEFLGKPEIEILNEWGCEATVYGNNDFRVPPSGGSAEEGNRLLTGPLLPVPLDIPLFSFQAAVSSLLAYLPYNSGLCCLPP